MAFTRDEQRQMAASVKSRLHREECRPAGHHMSWQVHPNSHRAGYAYFYLGTCARCGGTALAGDRWTSTCGGGIGGIGV